MHVYIYIYLCIYIYICIEMLIYLCVWTHVSTRICICTHWYVGKRARGGVCVCVCACMHDDFFVICVAGCDCLHHANHAGDYVPKTAGGYVVVHLILLLTPHRFECLQNVLVVLGLVSQAAQSLTLEIVQGSVLVIVSVLFVAMPAPDLQRRRSSSMRIAAVEKLSVCLVHSRWELLATSSQAAGRLGTVSSASQEPGKPWSSGGTVPMMPRGCVQPLYLFLASVACSSSAC